MKREIKYYFSFADLVDEKTHWKDILGTTTTVTQAASCDTLLNDYLVPRYSDGIVKIQSSETADFTIVKSKILAFLNSTYPYYNKLIGLFTAQEDHLMDKLQNITSDTRTLERSGSNSGLYINGEQKSETRENDTPQNGGDWSDDEHTSNISINKYDEYTNSSDSSYNENTDQNGTITSTIDPATIIERLNDIREKYVNLYKEWADKFSIFIYYPADFENKNEYGFIYYTDEEE